MAAVKKVLNVVFACEIRGRLRCSAASIGYRGRIRKRLVHSPVTGLSRNCCQARNYHCRPASALRPRRCRRLTSACALPRASTMDLRAACAFSCIRADLCTQRSPGRRESDAPRCSIRRPGDPSVGGQRRKMPASPPRSGGSAPLPTLRGWHCSACSTAGRALLRELSLLPSLLRRYRLGARVRQRRRIFGPQELDQLRTPRHVLHTRRWVDLSRRGWHERATYLLARVP